MAGISIEVGLDEEEARTRLQALLARMDNRRPFFAAVGDSLLESVGRRFREERGPDGTPWVPLKPATIKARLKRGRSQISILRERGHLAGSINREATNDELRIGSPVESAAIHQLGGTINKAARAAKIYRKRGADGQIGRRFVKKTEADVVTDVTIKAHTITIPARPFLGVSAEDQIEIFETAGRWLTP